MIELHVRVELRTYYKRPDCKGTNQFSKHEGEFGVLVKRVEALALIDKNYFDKTIVASTESRTSMSGNSECGSAEQQKYNVTNVKNNGDAVDVCEIACDNNLRVV